jgi:hypothetical protein
VERQLLASKRQLLASKSRGVKLSMERVLEFLLPLADESLDLEVL